MLKKCKDLNFKFLVPRIPPSLRSLFRPKGWKSILTACRPECYSIKILSKCPPLTTSKLTKIIATFTTHLFVQAKNYFLNNSLLCTNLTPKRLGNLSIQQLKDQCLFLNLEIQLKLTIIDQYLFSVPLEKILEKIVAIKLTFFWETNSKISKYQFGF